MLLLEPEGKEGHRFEGFLPVDDFLAQLELGLGHADAVALADTARRLKEKFPQSEWAKKSSVWVKEPAEVSAGTA